MQWGHPHQSAAARALARIHPPLPKSAHPLETSPHAAPSPLVLLLAREHPLVHLQHTVKKGRMALEADARGVEAPLEHHLGVEAEVEGSGTIETEAIRVVQAQYREARRYATRPILSIRVRLTRLQIVVERLTKNVHEGHLREIFGAYGLIRDVDLPMNRQCTPPLPVSRCDLQILVLISLVMTNRATAYIVYAEPPDAEAAIAHMHEAQLDGAVISVSIVLPRRKFSRSPPPSRTNPPAFDRDRYNERGPPAPRGHRGGPPPPSYSGRYRSPTPPRRGPPPRRYDSPPRRYDSPPRRYGGRAYPRDRDRDRDTYRPRSYSRSRSPSYSSKSRSRTPPRRSGGRGRTPPPPRGGRKRRSPSYSSYSSYSDRSRSRSRGKYGRR